MSKVTALQAKTRFGELLERVGRGEEIVITKHDKPVARIVPEGRPALQDVCKAVSELRALRRQIAKRPGFEVITDEEVRSAVEEGRR